MADYLDKSLIIINCLKICNCNDFCIANALKYPLKIYLLHGMTLGRFM